MKMKKIIHKKQANTLRDKTINSEINKWIKFYYASTIVIAICAVAGFVFSVYSSLRTSETLSNLEPLTKPYVTFIDRAWAIEPGQKVSCESPPIGLKITYKNSSLVPIEIHDNKVEVYYGERKFPKSISELGGKGKLILGPNEKSNIAVTDKDTFQKYLSEPKNKTEPPFLSIELTIYYSRLEKDELYEYIGKKDLPFQCDMPELGPKWINVDERNRKIR